jgi:choline-sulfatase
MVIYASDHGETCGEHRMFGKMSPYQGSVHIPLIARGPGVKARRADISPVSQLDLFPTIAEAVGVDRPTGFRGISLIPRLKGKRNAPRNRYVLSEYHCNGYRTGWFMVTDGRMKFVEFVGERPMLFDLAADPDELHDLVVEQPDAPRTRAAIARMRAWLNGLCSPQAVDLRAKADKAALRAALARTGQLARELYKRGYDPRHLDTLVTRPEIVPEQFRGREA